MKQKEKKNIVQKWAEFYASSGVEKEYANAYIEYVEKLLNNDLPPIFDFSHLTNLLGIYRYDLATMINCPEKYYRTFRIPKRSGGVREITAPYPSLKYVQTWISLVSGEKSPIVFNNLNFRKLQDKNYFSIRTRKFAERH